MKRAIWATCLLSIIVSTANASTPIVTYNIDLSIPGEFKVFASASADDNFGLALYGLPLPASTVAMITSMSEASPFICTATDANSVSGSAGFSLFRSIAPYGDGRKIIGASQNTVSDVAHLIRGLGQSAGNFSDLGLTAVSHVTQPSWDSTLLIAQGNYVGNASDFRIDTTNIDLMANVFADASGTRVLQAEVNITDSNGFFYKPQPPAPPLSIPPPILPPVTPPSDPVAVIDPVTPPQPPILHPEPINPGGNESTPPESSTGLPPDIIVGDPPVYRSFPPIGGSFHCCGLTTLDPEVFFYDKPFYFHTDGDTDSSDPRSIELPWTDSVDTQSTLLKLFATNYFASSGATSLLSLSNAFSQGAADNFATAPAPEPASITLAAIAGLAAVGLARRRHLQRTRQSLFVSDHSP